MSATARVMMTRAALHALATAVALLVSFRMLDNGDMPVRMALYAIVWVACGAAYFLVLYAKQYVLDAADERIRTVVRDERTVDDMRRYERRLRFIVRLRTKRRRNKD